MSEAGLEPLPKNPEVYRCRYEVRGAYEAFRCLGPAAGLVSWDVYAAARWLMREEGAKAFLRGRAVCAAHFRIVREDAVQAWYEGFEPSGSEAI